MVHICTFPIEMPAIDQFYQLLGKCPEGRWYYISKNYLKEFFRIVKEEDSLDIFLKELSSGRLSIMDTVSAWLDINPKAVLHLTMEEMNTFVELIGVSGETDVYLNLMDSMQDGVSIGQHIFINSLVEITRRFRDVN